MKSVEIIITPDGNVAIEAVGFKGKGCEKATKAFEEALGKVKSSTKKPEYHQTETVSPTVSARRS